MIDLAMLLAPLILDSSAGAIRFARCGYKSGRNRCILETFQSQRHKRRFQSETFLSLMRLRGMEYNSPSGYAEAFYWRKLTL